jgi:hypothetical protein
VTSTDIFSRSRNIYSATHQYLDKFSKGFWDNQWFGRNQIYLKMKLETLQFMLGNNYLYFYFIYKVAKKILELKKIKK